MKHVICGISLLFLLPSFGTSQKYFTKEGKISFLSETPIETIAATNNTVSSVLDVENSAIEFAVLIKAFKFKKALMEEHFNENYMESSKFPKAVFKGKIDNLSTVNFNKEGVYPVKVRGDMTIHGVTNPVATDAKIIVKNGAISGEATFKIEVADYDIKIPAVVRENIAKVVDVDVSVNYQLLNK